jgi:hypothetical protein
MFAAEAPTAQIQSLQRTTPDAWGHLQMRDGGATTNSTSAVDSCADAILSDRQTKDILKMRSGVLPRDYNLLNICPGQKSDNFSYLVIGAAQANSWLYYETSMETVGLIGKYIHAHILGDTSMREAIRKDIFISAARTLDDYSMRIGAGTPEFTCGVCPSFSAGSEIEIKADILYEKFREAESRLNSGAYEDILLESFYDRADNRRVFLVTRVLDAGPATIKYSAFCLNCSVSLYSNYRAS